jgi:hypothetical protein
VPAAAFPVIAARLVSMSPYQVQGSVGRLEVDLGSGWRSVCAAGMSEAAVQVVCRWVGVWGAGSRAYELIHICCHQAFAVSSQAVLLYQVATAQLL